MEPADLVFTGGPVHTVDAARTRATSVAVRGERIVALGHDDVRDLIGPRTEVVDLAGRLGKEVVELLADRYAAGERLQGPSAAGDPFQGRVRAGVRADAGAVLLQGHRAGQVALCGLQAPADRVDVRVLETGDQHPVTVDASGAYTRAVRDGRLTARVTAALWWDRTRGAEQLTDLLTAREGLTYGRLRATSVKIMQDGIAENRTAAMLSPYLDGRGHASGDSGISFVEPSALRAYVTELDARGFQVHFHALGDRRSSRASAWTSARPRPCTRRGARTRTTWTTRARSRWADSRTWWYSIATRSRARRRRSPRPASCGRTWVASASIPLRTPDRQGSARR